jgi:hypothetical protein
MSINRLLFFIPFEALYRMQAVSGQHGFPAGRSVRRLAMADVPKSGGKAWNIVP